MDITNRIDAVTKIGEKRIEAGGVQPPPKSVKIELTSKCNLRCKFCAVRTRKAGQSHMDMDFSLFKRLTRDMIDSGVEELGLFYLGESFSSPQLLIDAVKWTKQELGCSYVFLTSNATIAEPGIVREVMAAGLDSLKWSVNSADMKQWEDVTQTSPENMFHAFTNIKKAHELRTKFKFGTMLSASSIRYDGEQFDKMKTVVDKYVRPFVDRHYWLPLYQMGLQSAKIKESMGFVPTAGNMGRWDEEKNEPTRKPLPCWSVFTEGHVRVDGGLSACCFGADDRFDVGDLRQTSFMDAWNSSKMVAIREAQIRTMDEGQGALKGTMCEVCVGYGG